MLKKVQVVVGGLCLLLGILTQELLAAQVDLERQEVMVMPGQNATFMCRVAVPLQYCRAEIPGLQTYNLNPNLNSNNADVSYSGQGLNAGQCGFTIHHVTDKNNGQVKCSLGIPSEAQESTGVMSLIVARAPKAPELDLSRGTDSLRVYKIHDILQASCIVRDGRPVANISWYLDDEPLDGADLSMPTVVDLAKENLQSKLQNLTRQLRASDNGKYLRCVAYHPAYPNGYSETKRQLDIKYAPLEIDEPLDKFGYTIGKVGLINVTLEANPKPQIEWTIDGQKLREGQVDNTGRIEAEAARDLGNGRYQVNLRIAAISKQDTEKEYILTGYNDMGSQDYRIKISTNPEPKGLDLGIGSVIGIVVAILFLLLLVSILIFAKVTGRWCFSGGSDSRHIGESSDTESTDVRPKESRRHLQPIKLTAFFRKNKDKVSSEEAPETKQMETEGATKIPLEDAQEHREGEQEKDNAQAKPASNEQDKDQDTTPKEGLIYAELDLVSANLKPVVKNDDEKTEYAEILYKPEDKEEDKDKKETTKK